MYLFKTTVHNLLTYALHDLLRLLPCLKKRDRKIYCTVSYSTVFGTFSAVITLLSSFCFHHLIFNLYFRRKPREVQLEE